MSLTVILPNNSHTGLGFKKARVFKSVVFYALFAVGSFIASDLLLLLMGASFSAVSAPLTALLAQHPDNTSLPIIGVPVTCAIWIAANLIMGLHFVRQVGRLAGDRRKFATLMLATICSLMVCAFAYYLSISTVSNPLAIATGANNFSKLGVTLIGFAANVVAQLWEAIRIYRRK